MSAILDKRTGKRYGQVQFINEVVDLISTDEGREPCYRLIEALQARQAGRAPEVRSIELSDEHGVPPDLRGVVYELVDGSSDTERFDMEWRGAIYLKPAEAAMLLRVDARTVKRWAADGKLRIPRKPNARSTASRTLIPLQAERLGAKRRVCLAKVDVLFGFRSTRSPSPGFCDAAIHH